MKPGEGKALPCTHMEDDMANRVFRTCRNCGTPDQTATYRPDTLVVLCACCHVDVLRKRKLDEVVSIPLDMVRYSPAALAVLNASER